ncbi:hypothetical protein NLJ89_g7412 [Agrocybe chaxingu]|uniref:Uncharacterized protein n=1 Tax=Agrocybe chaxingu TaxID=84603 RepID=A0A9W8JZ77_9AGAR|nr:hypothetical protein NLJ89_g7412 [Agrocybe chaxingu]
MPLRPSIDDTNTTLINYQGEWELVIGSTRQWEGTVHTTGQAGATATFSFRGYQLWIWGTIPPGDGTNIVDISLDEGSPNTTSRTSNVSASYNELYYESPLLPETYHTVVVTNRGSEANGNTLFLLDRFEFETSDEFPSFSAPGGSTSSTSISTPTTSSVGDGSDNSTSEGATTPVGAIVGGVVGGLALAFCALGYFLWRRRKRGRASEGESLDQSHRTELTAPTPFPKEPPSSQSSSAPLSREIQHQASSNQISEKAVYQNPHDTESTQPSNPAAMTSSMTVDTTASSHPITSLLQTDRTSTLPLNEARVGVLLASEIADAYNLNHPPPSYSQTSENTAAAGSFSFRASAPLYFADRNAYPTLDRRHQHDVIDYQGEWEQLMGQRRQWEGGVHMTRQEGATATFMFRGYQLWIWGTIPAGIGTNIIDISLDGSAPNTTSRTSNGSAVFNEVYYESPLLRDTYHTVVVTNRGSDNTEFLLDRFEFETSDNVPVFTTTGTTTASAPTSTTTTSSVGNASDDSSSESSKTPVGAITGAVIGVLAVVIFILGYLLWRRRQAARASEEEKLGQPPSPHTLQLTTPTPFLIDAISSPSSSTPLSPQAQHQSSSNHISEKAGYQNLQGPSSRPANPAAMTSSTTLDTTSSSQPLVSSFIQTDRSSTSPSSEARVISSTVGTYDHPPPSYWQGGPHSTAGGGGS